MPQLMPFYWIFSFLMMIYVMMVIVSMYMSINNVDVDLILMNNDKIINFWVW